MLLYLFQRLAEDIPAFSVFNYLSLRAVLAALTALAIGFAAGPWVIRELKKLKIGQAVRNCGPKTFWWQSGFRHFCGWTSPTVLSGPFFL